MSGNTVIPFIYDTADAFSDGYARVGERRSNSSAGWQYNRGIIDRSGDLKLPLKYYSIRELEGDLLRVAVRVSTSSRSNASTAYYGVVDRRTGEEVIPCDYREISLVDGQIRAQVMGTRDEYNYYDMSGRRID